MPPTHRGAATAASVVKMAPAKPPRAALACGRCRSASRRTSTIMNRATPQVDGYLRKSKKWQEELGTLRRIVLASRLTEEVKWRVPCYTFDNHNIVFLGRFNECCTLSFVKGALLKDPHRILAKPGPNTQSARVIRFTSVREIVAIEPVLKVYIDEAIEVEKAGLKVKFKKASEFKIPVEFRARLDERPALKAAFGALTPGRQRAYLLYFSAAKQSKTRESRIEKWTQQILAGKGMDD
jgi:uncharacterized protein YdeI (YjbR/CyaY-like superfamily)